MATEQIPKALESRLGTVCSVLLHCTQDIRSQVSTCLYESSKEDGIEAQIELKLFLSAPVLSELPKDVVASCTKVVKKLLGTGFIVSDVEKETPERLWVTIGLDQERFKVTKGMEQFWLDNPPLIQPLVRIFGPSYVTIKEMDEFLKRPLPPADSSDED